MKDTLIWCDTKEKLAKVIAKLKKDGYSVPSVDHAWKSYGDEVTLRVNAQLKDVLFGSRSWYKKNGYGDPDMSADEFLEKDGKPSIVIFRRGRNVIAKDISTGNEGVAKCSPNDDFCFKTGASIAMARLMAKTPDALNHDVKDEWIKVLGLTPVEKRVYTDADRNFKVGDRVVVRDWDDMAKEYGTYAGSGTIKCPNGFTVTMKHLCGRTATVTHVNGTSISVDFDDKSGDVYWSYTKCMFNPIDANKSDDGKIHEGDTVKVVNTGLNYSSYVKWVGKHISDPYMAARFCFGTPDTSKEYKVIKIAEHERNHMPLAYIEETDGLSYNRCYLIEVKGLKKV